MIDYEYYGNGQFSIHMHVGSSKFFYDIGSGVFRVANNPLSMLAPASIQAFLNDSSIYSAIQKAIRIVSSLGGKP